MGKELYRVGGCEVSVPPFAKAQFERYDLQIPGITEALEGSNGQLIPFRIPQEALDKETGKLICLVEKTWTADDAACQSRGRQLPALLVSSLRPMGFANQLLPNAGTTPEEVISLVTTNCGAFFVPYYGSQHRFIDSRFHRNSLDEFSPLRYENIYLYDEKAAETDLLQLLTDAAEDIYDIYVREKGIEEDIPGSEGMCILSAVILSEYARRYWCSIKDEMEGGIVSFYEVLIAKEALRFAMGTLIDVELLNYDADLMLRHLRQRRDEAASRGSREEADRLDVALGQTALLLEDDSIPRDEQIKKLNDRWDFEGVRETKDYLHACVFSTPGARYGEPRRGDAILKENDTYDQLATLPVFWIQDNYPEYLENKYLEGSVSAMLAAQCLNMLADDRHWQMCPECGNLFKYKQGRYSKPYVSERKRGSDYCSDVCSSKYRNDAYDAENKLIAEIAAQKLSVTESIRKLKEEANKPSSKVRIIGSVDETEKRWKRKLSREKTKQAKRNKAQ